jgi:hypothetical protein
VALQITGPPDFTLSATPPSASVPVGKAASYSLSVGALNGLTGSVTLSASGLPAGARASFSKNPVAAPGGSTMTVQTTGGTRRGTFGLTVTGVKGTLRHQASVTLVVR